MPDAVQLMATCLADTFYPDICEAVVRVLRRAGVRVAFPPGQTCCGQPAFNAGLRSEALPAAQQTIRAFEASPDPVVVPSGSCAAMIRHGYLELFRDDAAWLARAKALASRTWEFTEFLVDVLGIGVRPDAPDLGARWPGRLAYHPSCHLLRELGVDRQPRALLACVRGVEIVDLPEREDCCGFGGVLAAGHPELSDAMMQRKLANFERTGAATLVVADAGCLTHLQGGLARKGRPWQVVHIAEVLDHV